MQIEIQPPKPTRIGQGLKSVIISSWGQTLRRPGEIVRCSDAPIISAAGPPAKEHQGLSHVSSCTCSRCDQHLTGSAVSARDNVKMKKKRLSRRRRGGILSNYETLFQKFRARFPCAMDSSATLAFKSLGSGPR